MKVVLEKPENEIISYFNRRATDQIFNYFFPSTQLIDRSKREIQAKKCLMRLELDETIASNCDGIHPLKMSSFGNVLEYAKQLFHTNFKTSISEHARSRLHHLFKYVTTDKARIKSTLHRCGDHLTFTLSDAVPDPLLLDVIRDVMGPIDFNGNVRGYFAKFRIKDDKTWLRYVHQENTNNTIIFNKLI